RISADSPLIDAERDRAGEWNLLEALSERVPTGPSSTKRPLTIDVDSVQVYHGTLQVVPAPAGPTYRVTNLDLDTSVRLPASGMSVNLRRLSANIAGPKMPVLYAAVSLEYRAVVSPAVVRLRDVELRTQQSTISILGEVTLARNPRVDLKLLV